MEFPRLVYKAQAGGAMAHSLAEDEAQHAALIEQGWSADVPQALAARAAPPHQEPAAPEQAQAQAAEETKPPTREEIVQQLEAMNVVFDRRLGTPRLLGVLNDAMKQPPAAEKAAGK